MDTYIKKHQKQEELPPLSIYPVIPEMGERLRDYFKQHEEVYTAYVVAVGEPAQTLKKMLVIIDYDGEKASFFAWIHEIVWPYLAMGCFSVVPVKTNARKA